MGCTLVLFSFLWITNVQFTNFLFLNFKFFIFKYSYIGLLWSKITIFIIEITLKLPLLSKYGWNNPNWGRLGLKNPKRHVFCHFWQLKIHRIHKHWNTCRAFNFHQHFFSFFEMLVTMSSIRINNNWNYQNLLITTEWSP